MPFRTLLFFVALLAATPATAQTTFSLHNPTLVVDGRYVEVEGAPLSQYPFTYVYINVPSVGTYTIASHQFEGSRRAGDFNDTYLEISSDGHQLQLWSSSRLLSANGLVGAYARLDRRTAQAGGVAIVSSSPIGFRSEISSNVADNEASVPNPRQRDAEAAQIAASREAHRHEELQRAVATAQSELAALQIGAAGLAEKRARLEAELARLRSEASDIPQGLAFLQAEIAALHASNLLMMEQAAQIQAERDQLAAYVAAQEGLNQASREQLAAERATLQTNNSELGSQVVALRAETSALAGEVARLQAERTRLTQTRGRLAAETDGQTSGATAGVIQQLRTYRDEAAAERDEYALTSATLRRENAELGARIRELEEQRTQLMQERLRMIADREQIVRERDALHREAERLRGQPGELGASNNTSEQETNTASTPTSANVTAIEAAETNSEGPESEHPGILLVDFDMDRLENPGEVLRFIDDVEFPRLASMFPHLASMTRPESEVLVQFATDDNGWVVQTEVSEPIGNGLDIVAQQIVRTMHFKAQVAERSPAAPSSQVTVAFNR